MRRSLLLLFLAFNVACFSQSREQKLVSDYLALINELRQDPQAFALKYKTQLEDYEEFKEVLKTQRKLPALVFDQKLTTNMTRHMHRFTPERRAVFLKKLEETASVWQASEAAGVRAEYVRLHRKHDPDFAREWEAALDRAFDPRLHQEKQA